MRQGLNVRRPGAVGPPGHVPIRWTARLTAFVGALLLSWVTGSVSSAVTLGIGRVNVDDAGAQANRAVEGLPDISGTGRYVVFSSTASNLVPGGTDGLAHVFVHDRITATTRQVDLSSSGVPANGVSRSPSISADGRFVAFQSVASNLVPEVSGPAPWHVYLRDLTAGTTHLVDIDAGGVAGNLGATGPSLSGDGRYVAFTSDSTNLVPGDTNGASDAFVRDMLAGTIERVSVSGSGGQTPMFAHSGASDISDDGRYVVMFSIAPNLVPGDLNGFSDVFVHDRASGANVLVTVDSSGVQANANSGGATISGNGQVVAFSSRATNLAPGDTNGFEDVFVHELATGLTERVSVNTFEAQADRQSQGGWLNFNGSLVSFTTYATNIAAIPFVRPHVVVRDRSAGTTELISEGLSGQIPDSNSHGGPISASGRFITFVSDATNLVGGDTNAYRDAFVGERGGVDDAAPEVSGTPDRGPNGAGWYNADVTIDWTATDPEPSAGQPDPSSAQTIASTEGSNVAYQSPQFCDAAGNCATGELALSIDETASEVGTPQLSVNPKSKAETATLTAGTTDALSGVVGGEYFLTVDPGEGFGIPMTYTSGEISATIGTALDPGVYPVGVRALDAAQNWSAPQSVLLVVYDPTAGFATGGGWITPRGSSSDLGDVLPGICGVEGGCSAKANFGFVVKYQNGASTVPGGNLEFHYNVGAFHLHSTAMEWLVVTNQNWAKFQGTAVIDGATGEHPFRVDARDGDPSGQSDRFVIKIWAPGADPDADDPLYKASGDVGGGQVKIHRT